jgi:hypothetical protein
MLALLLAATPGPSPSPLPQADPSLGSPGFIGFVFTFVLAVVVIGLGLLMTRELRKVNRRARLAAAAEAGALDTAEAARGPVGEPGADDERPGRRPDEGADDGGSTGRGRRA